MKKILLFIVAMALVLCVLTVAVCAEEVVTDEIITESASESVSELVTSISEEQATEPAPADETDHTIFTRVWEYIVHYKSEILSAAGDGIILIGVMILRGVFKKRTSDMSVDLKGIRGDTSHTGAQQDAVVDAVNELISGYNKMKEEYEKYEAVEDDRNKIIGAVLAQNTAILDILRTVYANNKNIPQGVKDMVVLDCANLRKVLGNDDTLLAVVDSVHEKISQGMEASEAET